MEVRQLSLFPEPKTESIEVNYLEYFQKHYGWNPEINEEAIVHATIGKNLNGGSNYVSGMVVKVISIGQKTAIVRPTESYRYACERAGSILKNELYEVEIISLGKKLN